MSDWRDELVANRRYASSFRMKDHLLSGDAVRLVSSPNHGSRFKQDLPDTIVIHYTASDTATPVIRTFCNPQSKVSAHIVIDRYYQVYQMIPFDTIAWHCGRSEYRGRKSLNNYSIGIEIVNAGYLRRTQKGYLSQLGRVYPEHEVVCAVHRNENKPAFWHEYTLDQIWAVWGICRRLIESYPIQWILGHEEISPQRKRDPGPAFPLDWLRGEILKSR